jgi:hypothetical protein
LVSACGGRAFSTAIGGTVFLLSFGVRFGSAALVGRFAAAFVGGRLVAVFPALATLFFGLAPFFERAFLDGRASCVAVRGWAARFFRSQN